MPGCNPETVFILPDPTMCGAGNIATATSQAGPCPPGVVVNESNCGDLVPTISGTPEDPALAELELLIQESGALDEAGFLWRPLGSVGPHIGADDGRRFHRSWAHFFLNTHPAAGSATATVFCEAEKRILTATVDTTVAPYAFDLAYRDVEDDYDVWTDISFEPSTLGAPLLDSGVTPAPGRNRIAMAPLPDGTLLLAYVYVIRIAGGPVKVRGVAVLKSLDCGLTWQFLSSVLEGVSEDHQLRLTVSGSWVRVDTQTDSVATFISAASQDGGVSWTPDAVSVNPATNPFQGGPAAIDPSPYAVIGVGGGAFLLAYTIGAASNWRLAQAFGGEAWLDTGGAAGQAIRSEPGDIVGMGGVVAHDRVYVVTSYHDGGGQSTDDQLSMYYHSVEGVFAHGPDSNTDSLNPEPGEWQIVQGLSRYRGARFLPTRIDLVNAGQYWIMGGGSYDVIDDSERIFKPLVQIGGYSAQSYGELRPGSDLQSSSSAATREPLYDVLWQNITGRPAGGSTGLSGDTSGDTEWGTTVGGAPTITFTPQELSIVGGVGDTVTYDVTVASTSADSWVIAGATLGMLMQCNSGSDQANPAHLVEIQSQVDATDRIFFQVRVDTTGITIRDINAVADAGSVAIDCTGLVEIRVRFELTAGGTVTGTLVAMRIDDYFASIVATDFVLARAAVAPLDRIEWGAKGVLTAGDTEWREVWISKNVTRDKAVSFNPDCQLGIPTAFDRTLVTNCLFVSWGGGAAAPGDSFATDPCFTHPASAIFTEACHIDWRSVGLGLQELILVADPDNIFRRFVHDSVVLCGIEDRFVIVDYDDNVGFASPSPTTTLDSILFTNLTALPIAGNGNAVQYTVDSNTRAPINGELAGMRFRFAAGPSVGRTFCIESNCNGVLILDSEEDVEALIVGGGVGTEFDVFAPFVFGDHASPRVGRFMRIRMNDTDTCTGDHRLGAIVAGCKIVPPFQLQWTHSDAETPDVTVYDGPGARWGYERAKPLRVWTGRIVNDNDRFRESFRMLMRSLTRYQVRSLALIVDEPELRSLIRGTFITAELENSFWWNRDDGDGNYRYPGGDMRISIAESP